jgi:hypothetical protein
VRSSGCSMPQLNRTGRQVAGEPLNSASIAAAEALSWQTSCRCRKARDGSTGFDLEVSRSLVTAVCVLE